MIAGAILWLSLNIYHEARGEALKPQIAVAHVTMNRAAGKSKPISSVIREKNQFSWTKKKKKLKGKPWKTDPKVFLNCSLAAVKALTTDDITGGATHYHESRIKPAWAKSKKMKRTVVLGPFTFYKRVSGG